MKRMKRLTFLIIGLCLTASSVRANTGFVLPVGLTVIGEEAFSQNTAITELELPESVRTIEARAFAECSALNSITIPECVTSIGEDAFDQCGEALLIRCSPESVGLNYAISHKLDFRADTTCRALVIGQTYTGTTLALQAPANDQRAVRFCLMNLGWAVTPGTNLTAAGILSAIVNTFSDANSNDISLFYYSGHGNQDGSLVGNTGTDTITPDQLRATLDVIPGRKVIIVDACFSGVLIEEKAESIDGGPALLNRGQIEEERTDPASQFILSFQSAFQSAPDHTRLRGTLNSDSYYVITAARGTEQSEEGYISSGNSGRFLGFFTNAFCLGLGYNGVEMRVTDMNADQNRDGAVSLQEAYEWAARRAAADNEGQHAAVWPTECRWFAPFRE